MRKGDEVVIFGRSPFINCVDINRLMATFSTVGFNAFGSWYPVDYLFYFDSLLEPLAPESLVFVPHHWNKAPKHYNRFKIMEGKVITKKQWDGDAQILGRRYFTSSIAINWCLLNGFTKLYLVGIDHVETDKTFKHHDGEICKSNLTPTSHQRFKQFVYDCANHVEIFQTNPDVKDQWALPYKPIEELYYAQQTASES